jgi:hypothetical protein
MLRSRFLCCCSAQRDRLRERDPREPYQIRRGDYGLTLGSQLRAFSHTKNNTWGVIVGYDTPTEMYTIQFQDFTTQLQLWTLPLIQRHCVPDNLDDTWSDEDRVALRSGIVSVWSQTTSGDIRALLESQERPSPLSSRSYLPSVVHEEYFPEFVWNGPQKSCSVYYCGENEV